MSDTISTRRQALTSLAAFIAGSTLAQGQSQPAGEGVKAAAPRPAPREELVDVPEFEAVAKLKLPSAVFHAIEGGDRQAFDRITLRPRMLLPTMDLDLSVELFGDKLFAPILIGPVSDQKQFHPDGELATVRGAAAAKAVMVVSSHSSVPIDQIAQIAQSGAQGKTTLWYQVYATADAKAQIDQAVGAGCKAICLTVGAAPLAGGSKVAPVARIDWTVVDKLLQGTRVPVLIKGVMTPADAGLAIQHGARGIVVSNYGGLLGAGKVAPIETLSSIVDAVAGKAVVLVDGSIRRGSDIIKALALGAQGVLLGRPAMWGLAAYGAEGVQTVVELLQSELARDMGMCGRPNLKALDKSAVRVHSR